MGDTFLGRKDRFSVFGDTIEMFFEEFDIGLDVHCRMGETAVGDHLSDAKLQCLAVLVEHLVRQQRCRKTLVDGGDRVEECRIFGFDVDGEDRRLIASGKLQKAFVPLRILDTGGAGSGDFTGRKDDDRLLVFECLADLFDGTFGYFPFQSVDFD
ncbi:hypothetical protein D1872_285450 [compost metagenome]